LICPIKQNTRPDQKDGVTAVPPLLNKQSYSAHSTHCQQQKSDWRPC